MDSAGGGASFAGNADRLADFYRVSFLYKNLSQMKRFGRYAVAMINYH